MIVELRKVEFENNFFVFNLPDNRFMILNSIQEDLLSSTNVSAEINVINIEIDTEDTYKSCSNIIGLKTDEFEIETDHNELKGLRLNKDNMKYCRINIYE